MLKAQLCFAQTPDLNRSNHWYFGQNAGLDFSSGTAVEDTNGNMTVLEGNATISDVNGNLLFYTDGKMVWNALHDTMMNGTGLGVSQIPTPSDGVIIIPRPGNINLYYIFTVDGYQNQWQNGLQWSEVDMTLDGGNGAITSKNNVLFSPCTEQLAATKHANGCDYWVTAHENNTANFKSYLVTSNGIDTVPVVSSVGTDYNIPLQFGQYNGGYNIVFTPDGSKAGVTIIYSWGSSGIPDNFELFDFNKTTGIFSNAINIPIDTFSFICGFSPNSQLLYKEMGYLVSNMYQYDISSGIDSIIINSKTLVHTGKRKLAAGYQIGADGKIYMQQETFVFYPVDSLSVINYPNVQGIGCDVQERVFPLHRKTGWRLTNFVSNFVINDSTSLCTTGIDEIKANEFTIYPSPADDFILIRNIKNQNFECTIYDFTARLISRTSIGGSEITVSTKHFNNGIYLLKLYSKNLMETQKILVQH